MRLCFILMGIRKVWVINICGEVGRKFFIFKDIL